MKVEVDFVKKYLQLEQARFRDRLRVNIQLDPRAEDAPVIPMLLQPLVENAIHHGISPLVNGGCIAIHIEEKEEQIHISIRDTGININYVKEVFREGHTYDVRMQNGDVVKVSRSYASKVKEIIF
jgi:sensor histidine kinase YesM